jgi:hypothetical protein
MQKRLLPSTLTSAPEVVDVYHRLCKDTTDIRDYVTGYRPNIRTVRRLCSEPEVHANRAESRHNAPMALDAP